MEAFGASESRGTRQGFWQIGFPELQNLSTWALLLQRVDDYLFDSSTAEAPIIIPIHDWRFELTTHLPHMPPAKPRTFSREDSDWLVPHASN